MSEAERPDRLASGRRVTVEDIRALAGPVDAPLRAPDPQPHPPPDRRAARGRSGTGRGRAAHRAPRPTSPSTRATREASAREPRPPTDGRGQGSEPGGSGARGSCSTTEAAAEADAPRSDRRTATSTCSPGDLESTGTTQDLMTTRFVPGDLRALLAARPCARREGRHGPGHDRGGAHRAAATRPRPWRHGSRRRVRTGQLLARVREARSARTASWSGSTPRGRCSPGASPSCGSPALPISRWSAATPTALPFRDASFDGVCCFAALHLFAGPVRRRWTRCGGC